VALCLLPFRFAWREVAFIAWVGLRGAVGIFLASIPLLSGLPRAELYFHVGFVVVLVSLLVQGWSVSWVARRLGVTLPTPRHPVQRVELDLPGQLEYEMAGYRVPPDSPILHHAAPPRWARLVLVVRGDRVLSPAEAGELRAQDHAYFLVPPWRAQLLDRLFTPDAEIGEDDRSFFGEFAFAGEVKLGALADLYGLPVPPERRGISLAGHVAESISEHPVVGDRLRLGNSALIVREVEGDRVTSVGLQLEAPVAEQPWRAWLRRWLGRPPA
jgi:cell volume regulation protein A